MTEPTNPASPQPSDEARLSQSAWRIVHEYGQRWWNEYWRQHPNSKAAEWYLRDAMAHYCVIAALETKDAELDAARAEIATLKEWAEGYNDVLHEMTKRGDELIALRAELARLRSAAPSGDLRAENERLRAVAEQLRWIGFERQYGRDAPVAAWEQLWKNLAAWEALASPQPDAGAKGKGGSLLEVMRSVTAEAREAIKQAIADAPSPSPEAQPDAEAKDDQPHDFVSASGSEFCDICSRSCLGHDTAEESQRILDRLSARGAPSPEAKGETLSVGFWNNGNERMITLPSPEAAPPSGDAREINRIAMDALDCIAAELPAAIWDRLHDSIVDALTRRDCAAAEKMREVAAQVADKVYTGATTNKWERYEQAAETSSYIRDTIRALPLPPAPKS